jgi:hypothetical protein
VGACPQLGSAAGAAGRRLQEPLRITSRDLHGDRRRGGRRRRRNAARLPRNRGREQGPTGA